MNTESLSVKQFQVGENYYEKDILKFTNSLNIKVNVHNSGPANRINYSIKQHNTALSFVGSYFTMWFVFVGYRKAERFYKCVYNTMTYGNNGKN